LRIAKGNVMHKNLMYHVVHAIRKCSNGSKKVCILKKRDDNTMIL